MFFTFDAAFAFMKSGNGDRFLDRSCLHVQQCRNHLQIVLDAMVNLFKQQFFLLQRVFKGYLGAFLVRDIEHRSGETLARSVRVLAAAMYIAQLAVASQDSELQTSR